MNTGVEIIYGDFAVGAKSDFTASAEDVAFNNLEQLKEQNLSFPNYANPCEKYQMALDGLAVAFPSSPDEAITGMWSDSVSDDGGNFAVPVVLELQSAEKYTSQGLTLTFDTQNNIFPTSIKIKWSSVNESGKETTLDTKEFSPASASYFCRNFVQNYNRVVITFFKLNMPKNRLKMRSIDYGYGTVFFGNELKSVKITQQADPISSELPINVADIVIDSERDMDFVFQERQSLKICFDGKLKATHFVKSSTRKNKSVWNVSTEDYMGILDKVPYKGGMYYGVDAYEIMQDIFATAGVPCNISERIKEHWVTGYIPYTTCRDALLQIALVGQIAINTTAGEAVEVYYNEKMPAKETISLDRIKEGQSFEDGEAIDGVEVVAHTYVESTEEVEAYKNKTGADQLGLLVKFSEPLHSLEIEDGEIIESNANYAIIDAYWACVLKGKKYTHTTIAKQKTKEDAKSVDKLATIESATLISPRNIDFVLAACYNWLIRNKTTNLGIIEGKREVEDIVATYGEQRYGQVRYGIEEKEGVIYDSEVNVGETIRAQTQYLGVVEGTLISQTYSLGGNTIVKEAVLK